MYYQFMRVYIYIYISMLIDVQNIVIGLHMRKLQVMEYFLQYMNIKIYISFAIVQKGGS